MKFEIPERWKSTLKKTGLYGFAFHPIFSLELNTFMLEGVLPALFAITEAKGQAPSQSKEKITKPEDLLKALLQENPALAQFNTPEKQRLLAKWLRASVMKVGKKGVRKETQVEEKIQYLYPLTYLAYKSASFQGSIVRKIPEFIYSLLTESLAEEKSAYETIRDVLRQSFAEGLTQLPKEYGKNLPEVEYNKKKPLEAETLLSIYANQVFPSRIIPSSPKQKAKKENFPPLNAAQAQIFKKDIAKFLLAYRKKMNKRELMQYVAILIGFELYIYVINTMAGVAHLFEKGALPQAFFASHPKAFLPFYADLTGGQEPISYALAKAQTQSHLEMARNHIYNQIYLRTADLLLFQEDENDLTPELQQIRRQKADNLPSYLAQITRLVSNEEFKKLAQNEWKTFKKHNLAKNENQDDIQKEEMEKQLELLAQRFPHPFERIVEIISEKQESEQANAIEKWLKEAGGLLSGKGILRGNLRRDSWHYAPSHDLLWALIHLAAIRKKANSPSLSAEKIRLVDFLSFLKERYGILIAEPPENYQEKSQYLEAAARNLEALQTKLKQMGLFKNLSDDFQAQFIESPFFDKQNNK
jgi:hypothetical protein